MVTRELSPESTELKIPLYKTTFHPEENIWCAISQASQKYNKKSAEVYSYS